ncbi:MAG: hypothetical protein RB191_21065 [Terriglobia bacterium]|nr:hypothetical protein [Terriglobia bacterium]
MHRALANRYLIERMVERRNEGTVYSEYDFYRGQAGLSREWFIKTFGKIPDGLVMGPGAERSLDPSTVWADWVEVEYARKEQKELDKIVSLASRSNWLIEEKSIILDRIVFVYDRELAHEQAIVTALGRYRDTLPAAKQNDEQFWERFRLIRCTLDDTRKWKGSEEVTGVQLLDVMPLMQAEVNE